MTYNVCDGVGKLRTLYSTADRVSNYNCVIDWTNWWPTKKTPKDGIVVNTNWRKVEI